MNTDTAILDQALNFHGHKCWASTAGPLSSLSGFLGHVALGGLDQTFLVTMALLAGAGSLVGSHVMQTRITSTQLQRFIGILLWVIAAKMALDLLA